MGFSTSILGLDALVLANEENHPNLRYILEDHGQQQAAHVL